MARNAPVLKRDGHRLLSLEHYAPYYLVAVTNAISRGASRDYLTRFGVGIMDWRVMTTLAIEPGCAAQRICQLIHLDKGAVSRSLTGLERLDYVRNEPGDADHRRRKWFLTEEGQALHESILDVALAREERLTRGVSDDDLETFLRVMRRMLSNISEREEG